MQLSNLIDYTQSTLDDVGVHYTQTGVSKAINEGNKILALATLYYERTSSDWTVIPALSVGGADILIPVPSDCIVPIYVRDTVTKNRINPVRISHLGIESSGWISDVASSSSGYKYYCIFNPMRPWDNGGTNYEDKFCLLLYPGVHHLGNLQIAMNYAAIPPRLTLSTDNTRIPEGHDLVLADYAIFTGLMRQRANIQLCVARLKRFFDGISKIGEAMKKRYPRGRDFEPQPIESLLERSAPVFRSEKENDRRRTSR